MIDIPVSFGELVDKLTILELKGNYIKDKSKSVNIKHELQLLKKLYKEYYNTGDLPIKNHIYNLKGKLYEIKFDDDFIFYARNIYKVNDKRAHLKRQINELVKSEIVEEKSYQKY